METGRNLRVRTSSELSAGEEIEAWHKGRLFHRGCVSETVPSTDLFWIVDSRTGARKLLDVEALEIVRVEKTVPAEAVRPETGRIDKTILAEAAVRSAVSRPSRREPHVVWFSSA